MSRSTLKDIESGDQLPDVQCVATFASLGYEVHFLLCGSRLPRTAGGSSSNRAQELIEHYRQSSTDSKRRIRELAVIVAQQGHSNYVS